jgi:hypothetical protein
VTSICAGGGPSQQKPGYGAIVQVGTFALGALANNWPVLWAVAYAGLLGGVNWDLTTMCATDPPADPGFTAADAAAMLTFQDDPLAAGAAATKLYQLLQRFGWYQFCECTSGTQPTPPAPPAAPVGLPTANPGLTQPTPVCGALGPVTLTLGPGSPVSLWGDNSGYPVVVGALIPAGSSNVNIRATVATLTGADDTTLVRFSWNDATDTRIGNNLSFDDAMAANSTEQQTFTVPPNAVGMVLYANKQTMAAGTQRLTVEADFFCGSAGGTQSSPGTCTPDAATMGMLQQILDLVTLIQRQEVPFSYIASTAHPGLSGNAQFAVQGLIGLAIAITTLPARAGIQLGNPDTLWDVGWIDVGTADGWFSRVFLKTNPQVVFPADMGAVTLVGYSIPPDTAVTVTELVREP